MKTVLKESSDKKYRVVENIDTTHLVDYHIVMVSVSVEVKCSGFLNHGYETIKEWNLTESDTDEDLEFFEREAIELFDKIVTPYKV